MVIYQSKLTLMSESLRNDGRIWVPKKEGDSRKPAEIPEEERDYYLERTLPLFRKSGPPRRGFPECQRACAIRVMGSGRPDKRFTWISATPSTVGRTPRFDSRYGNLFQMYEKIIDENPYQAPMMIYPAVHYTMGGLWVDYNLMSNLPGLHVLGEANFSDHGANRSGSQRLMQGLADGYFVIPYTLGHYLATHKIEEVIDRRTRVQGDREAGRRTNRQTPHYQWQTRGE